MRTEVRSPGPRLVWLAALVVGFGLRVVPLRAGKPYMAYVDEGNFLNPAIRLLRDGGWDPQWYRYPQFPTIVSVAAMRLYAPVYAAVYGRPLRGQIPPRQELYDDLEPFDLLLIGRGLSLALGLLIVGLTGLFARRLCGEPAGAAAALLAAVTPALVLRGSIASVDSYAAFFALACLFLTDRARSSAWPGIVSFAAGIMAGLAFASKYPSLVVIFAFAVTNLVERAAWREKLRRAFLGATGLAAGVVVGMPAVLLHTREVNAAIGWQVEIYGQMGSVSLWRQALERAEWDISYERPELGVVFVILAACGLLLGLRDRKLAPTIWGWCAFAAVSLLMYGRQTFRPFRNLLPLVPVACIAVSIFFVKLRSRLTRPVWANLAALFWLTVAFVLPLSGYALDRLRLRDPRVEAMDWLTANTRPTDEVLFVRELGFLNQELERLPARKIVRWWGQTEGDIRDRQPRFVVGGVLVWPGSTPVDVAALPEVSSAYTLRFRNGVRPTVGVRDWWRGNNQIVAVLERRAVAPGRPPK